MQQDAALAPKWEGQSSLQDQLQCLAIAGVRKQKVIEAVGCQSVHIFLLKSIF
jgi:hypothetical protein